MGPFSVVLGGSLAPRKRKGLSLREQGRGAVKGGEGNALQKDANCPLNAHVHPAACNIQRQTRMTWKGELEIWSSKAISQSDDKTQFGWNPIQLEVTAEASLGPNLAFSALSQVKHYYTASGGLNTHINKLNVTGDH
ncbi:unnamed protein product [Lota lota]